MRTDTYTFRELINIAIMDNDMFRQQLWKRSIDECMRFCRLLKMSLAEHNKKIDLSTQMDVIQKAVIIENYCRPNIYRKHFINIAAKYPRETPERHKELAKDKTEKTIRKYVNY